MTDKVQKIREGIEKLKSRLIRGACASQLAMETRCKEEAYNEVLAMLDLLQEEPVSDKELEQAAVEVFKEIVDDGRNSFLEIFKAGAEWQKEQDQSTIELAEDHAMLAGMEKMKEQMMKEAISATIESDLDPHGADYGNQKIVCRYGELESKKFKNGDEMKLIIIKEG